MEQATAEPSQAIAEPQQKPAIHRFTPANAAGNARKAHLAREQRELSEKLALKDALAQAAIAKPLIERAIAQAAASATLPDAEYRLERLARVREQIERLDQQMSLITDPRAIKALTDSLRNLADIEQKLAMRPLPGSHRPTKPSTPKPSTIEPSE